MARRLSGGFRRRRRSAGAGRRARRDDLAAEGGGWVSDARGGSALERLTRLLTLVPYLLAQPGASVGEVARAFGVTEKQLVDDLRLIWMCGLPGHTPADLIDVSWDGDMIVVSNADTIARPLRLDVDEASALLVAVRTLADVPELENREALDRVIAKLESAAGDAAASISAQIAVQVETEPAVVARVREALRRQRRLHLRYYVPARDEITERSVDPMRLLLVEGRSYLEAWCRRAEGVRLFRLDRVVDIRILDLPAAVPPEAEPRNLDDGLFQPSPDDVLVTLEVTASGRWVADHYPCERVEETGDGGLRVALRTPDTRWVRRLALRLGSAGQVIDPPELAEEVRAEAVRALAAYGEVVSSTPAGGQ
ncbi:MAG: WYL domain-containing protein [Streptosporangiales bacterium]|nr:WYL domain-containing protein [Streptosporangiales bacterium]